ncbi:UNVERIFIED_CONTAM: hypothetical protein FKN15_050965, partial [Acipenser sinensis]
QCGAVAEPLSLMALWEFITLSLHCWVLAAALVSDQDASGPLDWLLSDKGPFHRSQEYTDFVERNQQGFTTRYKIYRKKVQTALKPEFGEPLVHVLLDILGWVAVDWEREFGRWKVNDLAFERRDSLGSPLPLAPEFIRNIRLLGRRPSLQLITENLIKKYGTHFLLSGTLGGEEALTIFVDQRKLSKKLDVSDYMTNSSSVSLETLHQLAASYFIDRESTLRKLHHIQIASTAIKVILPDYLKGRFVQAALSYIACNTEGGFICKGNDCWCQCDHSFPECNCPYIDIQAMEESLIRISEAWTTLYKEFEDAVLGARASTHLKACTGQRSPARRTRERSRSPSSRGARPRRESRSRSRSPRRRRYSRSPRRGRRHQETSGVAELTSKMSQFMEVMMGQQSLLMTLANVVPRAPELPTGPVAGQPVVPPPVPHGQPQEVWDVDAVSRDASDAEPLFEEGTEPEVTSQHSEQDDPEVLDTNDPMWSVVERAARHLGVDWPASEPTRRSLFELPSAHTLQSRILPAFPDFIKEVQSTWGAPASTPATSRKAAAFNMHGASEAGLASFPPVGAAFAALVKAPTLSGLAKDPSCPNRQCRITEAHLKKGYAAATEAVRLSNVASLLTVYQAALLRDLPECPSAALRTELGTVAQLLVKLAQLNARAQGRSIASLVVARRQLWLSQARVQEPDKVPLLDAPISPGHTFGPAVEEMLQRSVKAREASQQLAKMWPSKPFQPRRPQERQWRRAPPQQQAQSRGSMTAPSGVSARGQPAFVRPQRGGWRPRGGGRPRPRGSGQAPHEFKMFLKRLPQNYFLNISMLQQLWSMDSGFQRRYDLLENSMKALYSKAQRVVYKLFALSKRCQKQPQVALKRERPLTYWLRYIQSLLYCTENNQEGSFSEETHSCLCAYDHSSCQVTIPCAIGEGQGCAACASDNHTRCGNCNPGYMLSQGTCKPEVADSTENYLGFETDLQDLELKYLLQKNDRRLEVHAIFISNDMRLNSWFDPSWRKRMLLTLKSNKYKSNLVHMLLGISIQICLTKNSTLEPVLALYVNPFGGSHSESWFMPVNENSFPDWERTKIEPPLECYNWTLTLGNKWKTFFETVHIYLRSRIKEPGVNGNDSVYYEPLEFMDSSRNLGYMKINSIQVFGYSMPFDPEAIRDLILQLDYPYTQGSQDSALLQLLEIRDRVNRLSPPGQQSLDFFSCLLRHRLKLATSEVVRIHSSLQSFNARLTNSVNYKTTKLCG